MKKFIAAAAVTLCTALLGGLNVYAEEGVYGSLTEFAEDEGIFSLPSETISEADSKSYEFAKSFEGAEKVYLEAALPLGDEVSLAISEEGVYIKYLTPEPDEGTPADMTIIIKDNTMYMLDNDTKTGYVMAAEGMPEELDAEGIMEEFAGMSMGVDTEADVKSCTVNIDGKDYTFEHDGGTAGILFDGDKIYAMIDEMDFFIIGEFNADVPEGIFEIPADYQIENLDVALYDENAPAPEETVPAGDTAAAAVSPETGNAPAASAAVTAAAMLAVMALTFKRTGK